MASSKGSDNKEELSLDEKVDQLHELLEATNYIKRYEKMLKNQNKRTIMIFGRQERLLKQVKETQQFLRQLVWAGRPYGLRWANKKYLIKYWVVKIFTLSSSSFKTNSRLIRKSVKKCRYMFWQRVISLLFGFKSCKIFFLPQEFLLVTRILFCPNNFLMLSELSPCC